MLLEKQKPDSFAGLFLICLWVYFQLASRQESFAVNRLLAMRPMSESDYGDLCKLR